MQWCQIGLRQGNKRHSTLFKQRQLITEYSSPCAIDHVLHWKEETILLFQSVLISLLQRYLRILQRFDRQLGFQHDIPPWVNRNHNATFSVRMGTLIDFWFKWDQMVVLRELLASRVLHHEMIWCIAKLNYMIHELKSVPPLEFLGHQIIPNGTTRGCRGQI